MKKTRKRIALKNVSPARQKLFIYMHTRQFGEIEDLRIMDGEPQLDLAQCVDRRTLGKSLIEKPVSKNFYLKNEHLELMSAFDEIGNGVLKQLAFCRGVPREIASKLTI